MSLRARAFWIGGVVLLMAYLALPSFFPEDVRRSSAWLRDEGLVLGLDLQGGIHWLLRVDEAAAHRQELQRGLDVLPKLAQEQGITLGELRLVEGTPEENLPPGGEIRGTGDVEAVRALLEEELDWLEVQGSGDLRIRLTDATREHVLERGVEQALEVVRRRVDALGVTEPVLAPQGEGRILVQLPGKDVDPRQARQIIEKTTFLEFKLVLDAAPNRELLLAKLKDGVPADQEIVVSKGLDGSESEAYLVPKEPVLTGSQLRDARLAYDQRGRPVVSFTWDSEGARIFGKFTEENIGRQLAAIVDEEVLTAPVIRSRISQNGQIEGNFTPEEAATLAVSLRSGALPIPLKIEEERTVGPSLGRDSIRQGVTSILIAGVLVVIFMAVYYRMAGWLADVALAVNLIIIVGLMGLAQATLTLPGLAGIVLTIGMAVDANVIIYERIREELRAGKSLKTAIQIGFGRSQLTILDSNITTLIAAVVLLYWGRGAVRGFGVTLAMGIVSTVFCALLVTRVLVDAVMARNPSAMKF